jgi:hypothetical protein
MAIILAGNFIEAVGISKAQVNESELEASLNLPNIALDASEGRSLI